MSRFTCEPIGFPKTKIGKWKYPAIFSDEKVLHGFAHEWFQSIGYADDTFITISRSEVEAAINDPEDYDIIVALMKNRITDDFKELLRTPKGYFLIREFS